MHHLLERQFKKIFHDASAPSPEWEAFLKVASETYDNYDKDRKLLERSFDISSKEFLELHHKVLELLEAIKIEKESVERKVIERTKELTLANERLLELDKAKTEFISVAAHQLRTPLSGIKWTLELVLDGSLGPLSTEQKSFLMKCNESNERVIAIINDMLSADRINSGELRYNLIPTQIFDLLDSVLFEMNSLVNKKRLQMSFINKDRSLPKVLVDTEKMRAVLQNLLENAIKYTPNDGKVEINFQVVNRFVQISIKDSGIGIPEEDKKNIFERFFRAKNAVKVETDGSGLGLFIAKDIIEKHGGNIWFESKVGEGTTFNFTIPACQ